MKKQNNIIMVLMAILMVGALLIGFYSSDTYRRYRTNKSLLDEGAVLIESSVNHSTYKCKSGIELTIIYDNQN